VVRPARRGGAPMTALIGRLRGPRAHLEGTGRLVPALVLRLGVLAVGLVLTALLVTGRPAGWLVLALPVLAGASAVAPGSAAVGVLGLLAVVAQLRFGGLDARAVGIALLLYVLWLGCSLAAAVPAPGRVEVAALLPALRRTAVPAVLTVLVAVAASAARAGGVRVGEQLLLLVGVLVLAGGGALAARLWAGRRR